MKVYRVKLTPEERVHLLELLSKGKAAVRTLTHARILLKADEGVAGPRLSDETIAEVLEVNRSTVDGRLVLQDEDAIYQRELAAGSP
jgi:hypothetical protein